MAPSMVLRKLTIRQFRAHTSSEITFAAGMNLIHGPNGAGKTNILEAIHYLCIGRSFIASRDSYTLQFKAPFFELRGWFEPMKRQPFDVRLLYKPDEGKRVFVNGAPLERLADLVGRVPVVLFAPGDVALTDGPPEERRRFLDNTLSQGHAGYLSDLVKYRRTMKQRNAVLSQGRFASPTLLEPWNEEFSRGAARITLARIRFVREFNGFMQEAYGLMDAISETPTIRYRAFESFTPESEYEDILAVHRKRLASALPREKEQRRCLVGPHRDDLIFQLNDIDVRRYASQGQHRTFGMALKLAKFLYLSAMRSERPILLLDDVFGDLDRHRASVFLNLLESSPQLGQSVITGADEAPFLDTIDFAKPGHTSLLIDKGAKLESTT